jgi:RHS repeat-associated protein
VASTFGVLDRLESETYPEPVLRVAYPYPLSSSYLYDGNGNVEFVTERKRISATATVDEVTDPSFDALGRLESQERYDGKVVAYEYDAKGNRTRVTDPDGVETSYTHDAQDRLETATTPAGQATYRYWPDGFLKGTTLPNGIEEARCYDPAGRLTSIVTARGAIAETCASPGQMVSRFDYEHDANGNRLRQRERRTDPTSQLLGSTEETRYGYDPQDRLIGVAYPDDTAVLYRLDPVGNRTGERRALASRVAALTVAAFAALAPADTLADVTATFNRADWLVSQVDARDASRNATYGYDLAGNLTEKVKTTSHRDLRWSYRDTLTAVLQGTSASDLAEIGRYDYDADLQRVKRTTGAEQVEYVLDERHVLQEATGATGHPSYRRYHYAAGPLAVVDTAGNRFISTDALGSPTDLTAPAGTIASIRKYDAWGQYRNDTAPTSSDPKLGYTGHQYDPETGLVYARARYYDADLGRFLSRDSFEGELADAPSLHRFAYAAANPLRFADPTGNAYDDLLPEERKAIQEQQRARAAEVQASCGGGNDAACEAIRREEIEAAVLTGPAAVLTGAGALAVGAPTAAGGAAPSLWTRFLLWVGRRGGGAVVAAEAEGAAGAGLAVAACAQSGDPKACAAAAVEVVRARAGAGRGTTTAVESEDAPASVRVAAGNVGKGGAPGVARAGSLDLVPAAKPSIARAPAPSSRGVVAIAGEDARPVEARVSTVEAGAARGGVVRYGSHEIGPLAADVASAFRGGSYTARVLEQSLTLYRTYGGSAGPLGRYWTATAPNGPLQAQMDLALVPQWGNTAQSVATIRVPAGTTIYEGFAAPQSTGVGQLLGGGSQVYIPRVDPSWLVSK